MPRSSTAKLWRAPMRCMSDTKHQNASASSSISSRNGSSRSDILQDNSRQHIATSAVGNNRQACWPLLVSNAATHAGGWQAQLNPARLSVCSSPLTVPGVGVMQGVS